MRSLYSGVSGLDVHQTKMDVIANNIANVNTVGYKSSRVTFSDFFSQSVSGASGASEASGRGGTNPMQIGLGATIGSIDNNMSSGIGQRTDNNFDLMIEGSGFFIVGDNSGTYFTRAGAFSMDSQGNLVTSEGLNVMGWDVDADGNPVRETVQPIQISGDKIYSPPQRTENIALTGNLNAGETDEEVYTTMRMFDSLGNYYTYDVKYVATGTEERTVTLEDGTTRTEECTIWDIQIGSSVYPNGDTDKAIDLTAAPGALTINPEEDVQDPIVYQSIGELAFDADGYPMVNKTNDDTAIVADGSYGLFDFVVSTSTPLNPAAEFGNNASTVRVDVTEMTQFNATTDATSDSLDGYAAGSLSDLNVGADGSIVGTYSNGQVRRLFQIPVAEFANPAGLSKVGGNLFQATINSGDFDGIGVEAGAAGGAINGGMLEMSNVDLSTEFTEMITTQRGFQANSRVITTSDEMLQELVNLK